MKAQKHRQWQTLIMAITFTAAMALVIVTPAEAQRRAMTTSTCYACFSEMHTRDMMRFIENNSKDSFLRYIDRGLCLIMPPNQVVIIMAIQDVNSGGLVYFSDKNVRLWTRRELLYRYSR